MSESLSVAELGAAFRFAPDAMLVVDAGGLIVAVNDQAARMFGYPEEGLIGRPVELLVPVRYHDRHRVERGRYAEAPVTRPMGARMDLLGVRADGREFPVEIALSPVQASEGPHVAAAVRDITERVAAEAAVRRNEERFRLLAERSSDMIYVRRLDAAGRRSFEYASPASYAVFGHAPDDFYANPDLLDELLHPDDRALRDSWRSSTDRAQISPPMRYQRGDGSWVWVEFHVSALEPSGETMRYEGVVRDITQRVEAESSERWLAFNEQLQEERERIAHDLHDGVLGALYGLGLELRMVGQELQPLSGELAQRLEAGAEELRQAMADLRAYVMDLRPPPITRDLSGSIADLCEHFEAVSGISTRVATDQIPEDVSLDAAVAAFHVVQEALNNVRKHASATEVEVELSWQHDVLSARVRDNGDGFDVEARPLISSIGMRSMAHRAHALGGAFRVQSVPREGTTVEVEIPVA